jgi:SWIM/SEC-C metal-binding protein
MAKLGTKKRPAVVRVQTEARAGEIMQLCNANGWHVIVGIEPDKAENLTDVHKLMNPPVLVPVLPTRIRPVSGNDYCPCGSGRKFKTCCGSQQAE